MQLECVKRTLRFVAYLLMPNDVAGSAGTTQYQMEAKRSQVNPIPAPAPPPQF